MSDDWYEETYRDQLRVGLRVKEWLHSGESEFQRVDIIDNDLFGRVLCIDGVMNTAEADEAFYHEQMVHPAMVTARASATRSPRPRWSSRASERAASTARVVALNPAKLK